jgi:flavin-dependent dehydrogenase
MTDVYDIVTIGGGLAGASLAKVMAERGVRVLVLERDTRFKDRVRGEAGCVGSCFRRALRRTGGGTIFSARTNWGIAILPPRRRAVRRR